MLRRSSSYDSFYQQARNRTNLRVLHDAPVTGIAFEESSSGNSTSGGRPRAIGVSYIEQRTGFVRQARARNEVILSMGAFHSPQLLMVSVIQIRYIELNSSNNLFRVLDLSLSLRGSVSRLCT